jgi:hypothetical protein
MPALTRRRLRSSSGQEAWRIRYGDVQVGTIAERSGVPVDADQWAWACGFYPGVEPAEHRQGSAATFDEARRAFDEAWRRLRPRLTEADFETHRQHLAFVAWKYRMRDCGCRMPTQESDGRSRCFCGVAIDIAGVERHIYTAHR